MVIYLVGQVGVCLVIGSDMSEWGDDFRVQQSLCHVLEIDN